MATIIAGGGNRKQEGERAIWIDTVTQITPTFSARITQHPIESNASITDHRFRQNPVFRVEGYIGGHPIYTFDDNLVDSGVPPEPETRVFGDPLTPSNPRAQAGYDLLRELEKTSELVTLVTELERYTNCLLKDISIPQDVSTSESILVQLTFEQVRIVQTEAITLVQIREDKQDNASPVTVVGNGTKSDDTLAIISALNARTKLQTDGEFDTYEEYQTFLQTGVRPEEE